jgi:hypothetical protein
MASGSSTSSKASRKARKKLQEKNKMALPKVYLIPTPMQPRTAIRRLSSLEGVPVVSICIEVPPPTRQFSGMRPMQLMERGEGKMRQIGRNPGRSAQSVAQVQIELEAYRDRRYQLSRN